MEVVARQQEHAVFAPLEALAFAAGPPDRGGAATLDHVDHLVEHESHRRQNSAWRDFADARLGDALLALELNERRIAAALFPAAKLQPAHVLDVVAAVDRPPERVLPGTTALDGNARDFTTTGTTLAGWMSSPTST